MKLIAENHITITWELFEEGMKGVTNKAFRKAMLRICLVLTAVLAVSAAWLVTSYGPGSLILMTGELICLAAILAWSLFVLPRMRRRKSYKAMCQKAGGAPVRTVRFFEDHLCVISGDGEERAVPYEDVVSWQETPQLYLITCSNKMGILLKKNGFSVGTAAEARALAETQTQQ